MKKQNKCNNFIAIIIYRYNTFDLPNGVSDDEVESITVADLLPHLSRIKRSKFSQPTSKATIIDAMNDFGFMTDDQIGQTYNYSNIGYNILAEIISKIATDDTESIVTTDDGVLSGITFVSYEQYIRETLLAPAGIDIDRLHSPQIGRQGNDERAGEWIEAQYHPYPGGGWNNNPNNPEYLEVYAGAGGWIMSPLHLLKFIATIDGFDQVTDILDQARIALLEKPINVTNNDRYMKGGGWATTENTDGDVIGREHNGGKLFYKSYIILFYFHLENRTNLKQKSLINTKI